MREGYGVDLSKVQWDKDAYYTLLNEMYQRTKEGDENYLSFCKDNNLDPYITDTADEFIETYENDIYCWSGFEGLLTDTINNAQCNGDAVFHYDDCCLIVYPTIPADTKDRDKTLTQIQIREILADYINPLAKEPVTIEWLEIHE